MLAYVWRAQATWRAWRTNCACSMSMYPAGRIKAEAHLTHGEISTCLKRPRLSTGGRGPAVPLGWDSRRPTPTAVSSKAQQQYTINATYNDDKRAVVSTVGRLTQTLVCDQRSGLFTAVHWLYG